MAPKNTSLRPSPRNKRAFVNAAWSRVLKAKTQPKPVRRLSNGLIDVFSKGGDYQDMIKANSETPLLQLPAELRNRVWKHVLGGNTFDVVFVETRRGRYIEEKTTVAPETFPPNTHALLQVCRQIYIETALIPFSANIFRFAREEAFDWARHLLPIQQESIEEVHIMTHRAERMLGWMHGSGYGSGYGSYLPNVFPIEAFPNVKDVVVKVGHSFIHDFTAGDDLTVEQQDDLIDKCVAKTTNFVKEARPEAKISFQHVNIKNDKEVESDAESGDSAHID